MVYEDALRFCGSDGAVLIEDVAPLSSRSLAGIVLDERYRLVDLVGAGGVGEVYRARHTKIPRDLAVKVLQAEFRDDADVASRFRREVRIQAKLYHPNIIEVFDFGEHPDVGLYIVMEFLEGESLADRVARAGTLQILDVLKIVEQCGSALNLAHASGVVHRDVKAENIFLAKKPGAREEFDVRLLDFGVAQVDEAKHRTMTRGVCVTPPGRSIGTPYAMSPEQISGARVDRRSDIYSFGVLLYELLAGELPFECESAQDYLRAHLVSPAPSLRARSTTRWVPRALDVLVLRMLEKAPERRPQTITEVLDCLDGLRTLVLSKWAEAHLPRRRRGLLKVHPGGPERNKPANSIDATDSPLVVIIDDEAATRFLIRQHISRAGYAAVLFATAAEGLEWLRKNEPPACVVVDLLMPKTNGLEFLKAVRARLGALPVIVCSGLESSSLLDEAKRLGASRVLQKHQLHRLPGLVAEVLDESRVSA